MSDFPTGGSDEFYNPTGSQPMDQGPQTHSQMHTLENEAIDAVETALTDVFNISSATTAVAWGEYNANASGGAFTVTLPAGVGKVWVSVTKTDSSANAVTVACNTGQTFADGTTTVVLSAQNVGGWWVFDGTSKWTVRGVQPGAYVGGVVSPSGGADDTAVLQAAANAGGVAWLKPGATFKLTGTTGITLDPSLVKFRGLGTKIDATGMTGGTAVTFSSSTIPPYNEPVYGGWEGIELVGPGSGSSVIAFGLTSSNGSSGTMAVPFRNSTAHAFGTGISIGANAWTCDFFGLNLYTMGTVISYVSGGNSGERVSFFGCTFLNSVTALDIANGGDFYFMGCSFDFNTSIGTVDWSSAVYLIGCHIEWTANSSTQLTVGNSANTGNGNALVAMTGGEIVQHGAAAAAHFASVPAAGPAGGLFLRDVTLIGVASTSGTLCDAWHNAEVTWPHATATTTDTLGPVPIGGEATFATNASQSVNSTASTWVQVGTTSITVPNDGRTYRVELDVKDTFVPGGGAHIVQLGIGTSTSNILAEVISTCPTSGFASCNPVVARLTGSGQVINIYLQVDATVSSCAVEGILLQALRIA